MDQGVGTLCGSPVFQDHKPGVWSCITEVRARTSNMQELRLGQGRNAGKSRRLGARQGLPSSPGTVQGTASRSVAQTANYCLFGACEGLSRQDSLPLALVISQSGF